MGIEYSILQPGNKVKIFGDGINVIFPNDTLTGEAFESYAEAEAFAIARLKGIRAARAGVQKIYLHVELSGGDGRNDPIGLANDGVEKLNIRCTARMGESAVSELVTGLPDTTWRIILRHADGSEYETVALPMVGGVIDVDYYTTNPKTGVVTIAQEDLTERFELGGYIYGLALVGKPEFKVYRRF